MGGPGLFISNKSQRDNKCNKVWETLGTPPDPRPAAMVYCGGIHKNKQILSVQLDLLEREVCSVPHVSTPRSRSRTHSTTIPLHSLTGEANLATQTHLTCS